MRRAGAFVAPCAVVLAVVLAVAACGSSHPGSSASRTSSAASGAPGAAPTPAELTARLKLAKCVREQGIDVPDPSAAGGPPGALAALVRNLAQKYGLTKLNDAIQRCRRYVDQAFPRLAQTPAALAQRQREALAFARCLRAHGIDVPDPQANGIATGLIKALNGVDQSSPAFKSAVQVCARALGLPAPAGSGVG